MPSEVFDFVHARLVLSHLPDRDRALSRMIASVKSGGWVLIEDFDQVQPLNCVDSEPADHRRANELHAAVRVLLAQRGSDLTYARKLPRLLRAAGLVQVRADAYFPVALPAAGLLSGANITQVRDALVDQDLATNETIDAHLQALGRGSLDLGSIPLISAWGQKL